MIDPEPAARPDSTPPVPLEVPRILPASEVFLDDAVADAASVGAFLKECHETVGSAAMRSPLAIPASHPLPDAGPIRHGRKLRLPGPGIWEAVVWMIGVHIIQTIAFIVAALVLGAVQFTTADVRAVLERMVDPANSGELMVAIGAFFSSNLVYLVAAPELATLIYALSAIRLRFGSCGISRLGWHRPSRGHWLLVALMVIPLQFLCSPLLQEISKVFPGPDQAFSEFVEELAHAPLPVLLLLIAIGPAFAEELIFRGLIGRGLVARWGFVWGVALTSLLFGVMHGNPGQAIAVIPLGIAMHYVYITTRSIWAPITLHMLNNGFAAFVHKFGDDMPLGPFADASAVVPLHVLTASAATITAIVILLWQTRVQYVLPDGSLWNPGYTSTEVPPADAGALPISQSPRVLTLAASTVNSLGFAAVIWRLAVV